MPVDFNDLKNLADSLKESELEIDRRNAVGRLYYSAFHHMKTVAITCKFSPHSGQYGKGSHAQFISLFEHLKDQPHLPRGIFTLSKRIGVMMIMAKKWRVLADYNLDQQLTSDETYAHFVNVQKIHDLCREIDLQYTAHNSMAG